MTNIKEAIREEIVRRLNEITIKVGEARPRLQGKRQAYLDVLALIDSQTDEPSRDLDEAAKKHADNCLDIKFPTLNEDLIRSDVIYSFKLGAQWQKEQPIEFDCIGKKVKMTTQELIDYYIDSECCDVADECGF